MSAPVAHNWELSPKEIVSFGQTVKIGGHWAAAFKHIKKKIPIRRNTFFKLYENIYLQQRIIRIIYTVRNKTNIT